MSSSKTRKLTHTGTCHVPGAVPGSRVLGKISHGPEGPPSLEMLTDVSVDSEDGQSHLSHPGECQPGLQWSLVGFQERGLFKWKLSEK